MFANVVMLAWDLGTFLTNSASTLKIWIGAFTVLLGVVMLGFGVWQIGSGLWSHGKKQTNWFMAFALLIVGGAFMSGGWSFVELIASGGQKTIEDLGAGGSTTPTMLPWFLFIR